MLSGGLTHTTTRSSINSETRTSQEGKLFSYETGSRETAFQFVVESDRSSLYTLRDAAFIVAGFRFVRSLGSNRRRGKGECIISLVRTDPSFTNDSSQSWFLEKLKQAPSDYSVGDSEEQRRTKVQVESSEYVVELVTDEPVLITRNRGSGNKYEGLDFIPGSTLRGALAWKAIRGGILQTDSGKGVFKSMFNEDALRVSNCYPASSDTESAIRIPANLRFCELYPKSHSTSKLGDRAVECTQCEKEGHVSKMEKRDGFLNSDMSIIRSNPTLDMHIAIDSERGVVQHGALYEYESIPAGSRFVGHIGVDRNTFSKFLSYLHDVAECDSNTIRVQLQIGKATTRGYGKSSLTLTPTTNGLQVFTWEPIEERVTTLTKPITMSFISDVIIVDEYGRYVNKIDEEFLKRVLGLETKIVRQTLRTRIVERFDTRSGLPRWRDSAIVSGSVVEFIVRDADNKKLKTICERLRDVELEGLGLRTMEGFGCICFNHPTQLADLTKSDQEPLDSQELEGCDMKEVTNAAIFKGLGKKDSSKLIAVARLLFTGVWSLDDVSRYVVSLDSKSDVRKCLEKAIERIKKLGLEQSDIRRFAEDICLMSEGNM